METLHPAAQVTALVIIGAILCVLILSLFTTFFDKN